MSLKACKDDYVKFSILKQAIKFFSTSLTFTSSFIKDIKQKLVL